MKVKAIWEFDADVDDIDERFVDKSALAKELTERELQCLLENNDIQAGDFEYVVEK